MSDIDLLLCLDLIGEGKGGFITIEQAEAMNKRGYGLILNDGKVIGCSWDIDCKGNLVNG
jgi:hypothetical protein